MSIDWIRDAEAALALAHDQNNALLIDFSAAPS